MKRLFTFLMVAVLCAPMWSCGYDDRKLWDAVDDLGARVEALEEASRKANSDIASLQSLVEALQGNLAITSVEQTADGYTIHFSEGDPITITNGRDGVSAPTVGVKQDTDGVYYWTLDGEWLTDEDGNRVKASGEDGAPGQDAVAPQVRINADTKEWEISTDGGLSWTSTGVSAEGREGDSLFSSVQDDDPDWVTFVLNDGSEIRLPKADAFSFVIEGVAASGAEFFLFGETRSWNVTAQGVADCMISRPDGWKAAFEEGVLSVTAPAADNTYAEPAGVIAIHAVSASGLSRIVKLPVEAAAYRLRVLTFEDGDYRGSGNYLGYNDWSSLIDTPQYGGPLLYGPTGMGPTDYNWYDENNTFLQHTMPVNWGSTCYWSGGHAISDYVEMDTSLGDYDHQLAVFYKDPETGFGGHNGSKNFCVHYGYHDNSGYSSENLPALYFGDGVARVVDHMYVTMTTFLANTVENGNGLTAPAGPDDYVRLVAIGYDADGAEIEIKPEFYLVGPQGNVTEWTRWDLSSLGAVSMIEFNVTGSNDNGYGFSQPAYFAYDDVAVRF